MKLFKKKNEKIKYKWEKMNKTKSVLRHLEEKGSITSWEAIKLYGATRLSSIIYNLRHKYRLEIINEEIQFKDRFGNNASYVKYVLVKKGKKNGKNK